MCCPVDHMSGKLLIRAIAIEETGIKKEKICYVRGTYDRTPTTLADRVFRFFQRLELIEKIAEIADESFHLFGTLLQRFTSVLVYQNLRQLHHAAHDVEHLLHSFCFLGDVTRLATGKFFEYEDKARTQLNYLRSIARVCHAIGHFFATATFLSELKLCQFGQLEKVFKYAPVFNAAGYTIWTISLIWQHYQGKVNHQLTSDLGIHLAGGLFEAIPLSKTIASLAPYASVINKITAVAGIIHAWSVVHRLMPKDQEEVMGNFVMPQDEILAKSPHQHHHHSDHHDHQHQLKFHPVKIIK